MDQITIHIKLEKQIECELKKEITHKIKEYEIQEEITHKIRKELDSKPFSEQFAKTVKWRLHKIIINHLENLDIKTIMGEDLKSVYLNIILKLFQEKQNDLEIYIKEEVRKSILKIENELRNSAFNRPINVLLKEAQEYKKSLEKENLDKKVV